MKCLKILVVIVLAGSIMFMTACNRDDDLDFTGNIETFDQVVAQNNVFVELVSIDRPGWIIIHEDINGSPGEIISYPTYIGSAGTFTNNFIPLDSSAVLTDSMEVIIMLYHDNGTGGVFDPEDQPVTVDEQPVTSSILLFAPSVTVNDQPITNNVVVVEEIITGFLSWVAIYQVDVQGEIGNLVGFAPVNESPVTNLEVQLTDTVEYVTGASLTTILHLNNLPHEQFTVNDVPLVFGFDEDNIVSDSFVVQ
jgi:hypothetical protein